MDKIETMRAFIAVAQEGSFTEAGRRLGLSTKLVSKYVQHLESGLKTQLFNRTTRSVSLTDVGAVGACFISHYHRDLSDPAVAALKARGMPVLCWTICSPEDDAEARRVADNVTFEGYLP